jgi:hypothetical protein
MTPQQICDEVRDRLNGITDVCPHCGLRHYHGMICPGFTKEMERQIDLREFATPRETDTRPHLSERARRLEP